MVANGMNYIDFEGEEFLSCGNRTYAFSFKTKKKLSDLTRQFHLEENDANT